MKDFNSIFNKDLKYNNKPVYDFLGLRNLGYRLNIINGIQDDGKTFGAKFDMLERFVAYGEQSIWLMNDWPTLRKDMQAFIDDPATIDKRWLDFKIVVSKDGISIGYYKEKPMTWFMSLSSTTKMSRNNNIKNIYYDEFNYLGTSKRVYNIQIDQFMVLLSRNMHINKIFLIGNAVSLNIPLLFAFGIYEIKKEWTEFKIGNMTGIFHLFKRPLDVIEKKYNDSISYSIMKTSGYVKHAFENKYLKDNLSRVDRNFLKNKNIGIKNKWYTTRIDNNIYVNVWKVYLKESNNYLLFFELTTKESDIKSVQYAISRDLAVEGNIYDTYVNETIAWHFKFDRIIYGNVIIKQKIFEHVKMYF